MKYVIEKMLSTLFPPVLPQLSESSANNGFVSSDILIRVMQDNSKDLILVMRSC